MNKKILVVDDEPEIARLIQISLAVDGYDVCTATNGWEALAAVEQQKPELIVLDIMMPRMNGYDVCVKIKSLPENGDIKILFLTALGNPGDAQHAFQVGADDYIVKPFDPEELVAKVRAIIGPGD